MAVSPGFRTFILEQLEQAVPGIRDRRMFGGVGLYAGDDFFGIIDSDTLYFKVDDQTRPRFEAEGMEPFRPYGPDGETMGYYQVPASLLEDVDVLRPWVRDAVAVAQRAKTRKRPKA
jgi:DNA transformation protein